MKLQITSTELKQLVAMDAGWRSGKLKEVKSEPSAKKDSMNTNFVFEVENAPGDVRTVNYVVNDKNRKYFILGMVTVYEALFDTKLTEEADHELPEPESWISMTCWLEVSKEVYQGRFTNQIVAFCPASKMPF